MNRPRSLTPAGRIVTSALLVAAVATSPARAWPACLALAVVILLATRPGLGWLARRAWIGALPIAALVVAIALGDAERAVSTGSRALASLLIALAIGSTIELAALPGALASLGAPRALSATIFGMLWQLEHVRDEGRRLLLARRLRGDARLHGPDVLAQLLIRTHARAERVDLALRLRGADGPPPGRRLGLTDAVAAAASVALGVGLHGIA